MTNFFIHIITTFFLLIVICSDYLSKPKLSPEVICSKEVLNFDAAPSSSKSLFVFQMGNTGSFSHFCSDQDIPDEVNYL